MTRVIEPTQGRVLVKLGVSEYGNIPVPPKDYDSITWGLIVKVNPADKEYSGWVGKFGHWRRFKDDMRVDFSSGNENFALVDIIDIMGISYEE